MSNLEFLKWPKIGQFHNVRKSIKKRRRYHQVEGLQPYTPPTIIYRAKIKLDGTNAAIRVNANGFITQSRSQVITPENDNNGFSRWVHETGYGKSLVDRAGDTDLTVFGEWCGRGIQKRTAISKVDGRLFCVFAIMKEDSLFCHPSDIIENITLHPEVFVLPWIDDCITIRFRDTESLDKDIHYINQKVSQVESCDPWVKETFGIEGLGEGLVYYPLVESYISYEKFSDWAFKAKGEKHQVVKQNKPVLLSAEEVASVNAFVDKFVTPNRLEQGLQECGGEATAEKTGDFLKWVGQDIKAESKDELEASNLNWKDISKQINTSAREWWFSKL